MTAEGKSLAPKAAAEALLVPEIIPTHIEKFSEDNEFFKHEAPKLIADLNIKGVQMVARKLGIELPYTNPVINGETFLKAVLDINRYADADTEELLREATGYMTSFDIRTDFNNWSHSVCHPIETYRAPTSKRAATNVRPSFLDTEVTRRSLDILVNDTVRRQREHNEDIGNSERIIGPISKYNLANVTAETLEKPWPYKPGSLTDSEYQNIVIPQLSEYNPHIKFFLESERPIDFFKKLVEEKIEFPSYVLPGTDIEILTALEAHLPKDQIAEYVGKNFRPKSDQALFYGMLKRNLDTSKEAQEKLEGIFVDVDGTLLIYNKESKMARLNTQLLKELEDAFAKGKKITIFSGGEPETLTEELLKAGVPEKFLPVQAKKNFRGKVLELLVDDTPPEYQGFGATNFYSPFEHLPSK